MHSIINGKLAEKYKGSHIDAMKAIATAHDKRSLLDFEQALIKYKKGIFAAFFFIELGNDAIIKSHLTELYDTLLEQNLLRIIEPYSRVEVAHIATLVKLPVTQVETKYFFCIFCS